MKKKILIKGAAGDVGSHTADATLAGDTPCACPTSAPDQDPREGRGIHTGRTAETSANMCA